MKSLKIDVATSKFAHHFAHQVQKKTGAWWKGPENLEKWLKIEVGEEH